eukprot:m.44877 g.44877  ORF g.44877 m.44877 type:complete len:632 (+) comp47101_c0_seq4:23-1918(+)
MLLLLRAVASLRQGLGVPMRRLLSEVALRPYQKLCVDECLQQYQQGVRRQVVSLPVGSGKTVIMSALIRELSRVQTHAQHAHDATRVLVLAHREELLLQARHKIQSINPNLRVALYNRDLPSVHSFDVVIASVPTLGRAGAKHLTKFDPGQFKCIIIDEAHHAAAMTYQRILAHFNVANKDSHVLLWGCSATVRRHDGIALETAFEKITFQSNLFDMWNEDWLTPLVPLKISSVVDLSAIPTSASGDFGEAKLAQAVNTSRRNQLIVSSWKKFAQHSRKSTLVFAVDVQHARDLADAFNSEGIEAFAVDGSTEPSLRAQKLDEFRGRSLPVMINCNVFTEGTDIPCVDCILLARPTKSSVLFQQMIGRGLRLYPDKPDCLCLDIVDNVGRNTVFTTPTLLGFHPEFDTAGLSVMEAFEKVKRLADIDAEAALARSVAEAEEIVQKTAVIAEQDVLGRQVDVLSSRSHFPAAKLSSLKFTKVNDDYMYSLYKACSIRVYPHLQAGNWIYKISVMRFSATQTEELPFVGADLEMAFAAAKTFLSREFSRELFVAEKIKQATQKSDGPITAAQLTLLKKLMPRAKNLHFLRKQKASELLERFFARQKRETMERQQQRAADRKQATLSAALKPLE